MLYNNKAGDELLRKVAEGMKEECRADDIIARIGGDEFAVILPKTDSKQAEIIAIPLLFRFPLVGTPRRSRGKTSKQYSKTLKIICTGASLQRAPACAGIS